MALEQSSERLIRIVDEHWIVYIRPFFFCCIVLGAGITSITIAGATVFHLQWIFLSTFIFGFACLLLAVHGFFIILMSEALSQIVITNKRVVHFKDFLPFKQDMLELSFDKMKTVEVVRHGLLQSVLNYGSLNFEQGKAQIHYVPHPNSVARDIYQAMGML